VTLLSRLRSWPVLAIAVAAAGGMTVPAAAGTVSPVPTAGAAVAIPAGAGCPASMRSWVPGVTAPVPGDPQALAPASLSHQAQVAFGATAARMLAGHHVRWVTRTSCPRTHSFSGLPSRGVTPDAMTPDGAPSPTRPGTAARPDDEGQTELSANWSGYQSDGSTYTGASMDWTVPPADPTVSNGAVSIWPGVGTGNDTSDELVQAGTQIASDGAMTAWTEVFPKEAEQPISGFPVSGGDQMSVHVTWDPATQTAAFLVIDYTTGNASMSSEQVNGSSGSTAEWIAERPGYCDPICVYQPLMKFPTESISNGSADVTSGGVTQNYYIGSLSYYPYQMVDCHDLEAGTVNPPFLADPSANTDGLGDFTDVWKGSGPSGDSDDPNECSWAISPGNAPFKASIASGHAVTLADSTAHDSLSCTNGALSGTTSDSPQASVPADLAEITGGGFTGCTDRLGGSWSAVPASGSSWDLEGDSITVGGVLTGGLAGIAISVTGTVPVGTATGQCSFQLAGAAPEGDVSYDNGEYQLEINSASLTASQVSGSGCTAAGIKNNDAVTLSGTLAGNATFLPGTS
jgi:hypothetical protein